MTFIKQVLGGFILLLALLWQLDAKAVDIEFLQASINPQTVDALDDLACRNLDHIVHLKIVVDWPSEKIDAEKTDLRRLIFWNDKAEFLFPLGAYALLHGSYVVKGYFIVRSGGIHQGIISHYFEKIADAKILSNPDRHEIKAKGGGC